MLKNTRENNRSRTLQNQKYLLVLTEMHFFDNNIHTKSTFSRKASTISGKAVNHPQGEESTFSVRIDD